jgi:hypothetical protein
VTQPVGYGVVSLGIRRVLINSIFEHENLGVAAKQTIFYRLVEKKNTVGGDRGVNVTSNCMRRRSQPPKKTIHIESRH